MILVIDAISTQVRDSRTNGTYNQSRTGGPGTWSAIYDKYFKDCEFDTSQILNKKYNTRQKKINSILKNRYLAIQREKARRRGRH